MTEWKNRIVGYGEEAAADLKSHPQNWRGHPAAQLDALRGAIEEIGFIQDVIVSKRTMRVIDGHARVALALARGERVPVVYVDLDENEERLALLSLDPISGMAVADQEMVDALLADAQVTNDLLRPMLEALASPPPAEWGEGKKLTQEQIDAMQEKLTDHFPDLVASRSLTPLTCPACGSAFSVSTHDLATR